MRATRRAAQGQICPTRQGGIPIKSVALIAIAFLAYGCSGGARENKTTPEAKPKPSKPPTEPVNIATGSGSNDHYSTSREKLWTVRWKAADLETSGSVKVGKMRTVTGEVFEKGKISSTFAADRAEAENRTERLKLSDRVVIKNKTTTLRADRVVWIADKKLYQAEGRVTLESAEAMVGPLQSLFVTAKLDKIGTSDRFFK